MGAHWQGAQSSSSPSHPRMGGEKAHVLPVVQGSFMSYTILCKKPRKTDSSSDTMNEHKCFNTSLSLNMLSLQFTTTGRIYKSPLVLSGDRGEGNFEISVLKAKLRMSKRLRVTMLTSKMAAKYITRSDFSLHFCIGSFRICFLCFLLKDGGYLQR